VSDSNSRLPRTARHPQVTFITLQPRDCAADHIIFCQSSNNTDHKSFRKLQEGESATVLSIRLPPLSPSPLCSPCGKTLRSLEHRMNRQGNPNWGKSTVPVSFLPTGFEEQVEKLGLWPDEYPFSRQLRSWCAKNASSHYVPEYLLKV
jgi:hypothetical protein